MSGTISGSNELSLTFNLTFDSPTLKKYTGTGTGAYATAQKTLGGNLTGKDASGTFVGQFVVSGVKE